MFRKMWNFPNCVGAVDGKHCALHCPPKSGSRYFNWKHSFSFVLLAVVDATYRFLWVDIGRSGGCSDSGLFRSTAFGNKVIEGTLNLPADELINGSHRKLKMPYVFVGDEAFPLVRNLMRPYSGRKGKGANKKGLSARQIIFNYRLSRARHMVESAFGILASRNRIFKTTTCMEPKNYTKVIMAAVVLHNYLCKHLVSKAKARAEKEKLDDIQDKQNPQGSNALQKWAKMGYHANKTAVDVREELTRYFYREGQIPWQWKLSTLKNKKIPQLLFDAES